MTARLDRAVPLPEERKKKLTTQLAAVTNFEKDTPRRDRYINSAESQGTQ